MIDEEAIIELHREVAALKAAILEEIQPLLTALEKFVAWLARVLPKG